MLMCPKCGCEEFEIEYFASDRGTCYATVAEGGEIETYEWDDEEVMETDYFQSGKCVECGANVDLSTGEQIPNDVRLGPYSVLLMGGNDGVSSAQKPYWEHVYAEDVYKAVDEAKDVVRDREGILAGRLTPCLTCVGHIDVFRHWANSLYDAALRSVAQDR